MHMELQDINLIRKYTQEDFNKIFHLLSKSELNDVDLSLINEFITYYLGINYYVLSQNSIITNSEINIFLNNAHTIINYCYMPPIGPAKELILSSINQSNNHSQELGNTRTLTKSGVHYDPPAEITANVYPKINGYISNVLIVTGVIILGIIIAIILK